MGNLDDYRDSEDHILYQQYSGTDSQRLGRSEITVAAAGGTEIESPHTHTCEITYHREVAVVKACAYSQVECALEKFAPHKIIHITILSTGTPQLSYRD
jgi:hypothetical protein